LTNDVPPHPRKRLYKRGTTPFHKNTPLRACRNPRAPSAIDPVDPKHFSRISRPLLESCPVGQGPVPPRAARPSRPVFGERGWLVGPIGSTVGGAEGVRFSRGDSLSKSAGVLDNAFGAEGDWEDRPRSTRRAGSELRWSRAFSGSRGPAPSWGPNTFRNLRALGAEARGVYRPNPLPAWPSRSLGPRAHSALVPACPASARIERAWPSPLGAAPLGKRRRGFAGPSSRGSRDPDRWLGAGRPRKSTPLFTRLALTPRQRGDPNAIARPPGFRWADRSEMMGDRVRRMPQ